MQKLANCRFGYGVEAVEISFLQFLKVKPLKKSSLEVQIAIEPLARSR